MTAVSQANFPSGAEYVGAIQNPGVSFLDADLRGGRPELTKLGMPKPISGNFASVFSLTAADRQRYAVKCFTRDVPDQRERYEAISRYLNAVAPGALSQPWKMDFTFLPEEILVNGRRWPVMKMAWVEAVPLDRWLADHRHDRRSIQELADRFVALVGDLERLKIAHGDLQHGNLLVAADNTLRLVDYDGMYVPALAARDAAELGHRHYQSPARGTGDFTDTVDRFSAWIIYLSLAALAVEPLLWDHLRDQGSEHLLTADEDYQSPAASWRLDQIASVSPEMKNMVGQIRRYAQVPLSAIPTLAPVAKPMPLASSAGRPTTATIPTATAPGRPAWLDGHLTAGRSVGPAKQFDGRRAMDRVVMVALTLYVFAVVTSYLDGFLTSPYDPGALVLCGCLVVEGRRSRPEWREAREARKSRRAQLNSLSGAAASMRRMSADFESNDERLAKRLVEVDRARAAVEAMRKPEYTAIDRRSATEIGGIDKRLRGAEDAKQLLISTELRNAINAHLTAHLRRHNILAEVKEISGLGPTLARALANHGIVTAADVHVTLVNGSGSYTTRLAYFQLPHGHRTRIEGIGERKAGALQSWRDGLLLQAQRTAPTTLPQTRLIQINQQHAASIAQLKAERDAVQARAVTAKDTLNRRLATEIATLADHKRRAESERAVARAAYERDSSRFRATAQEYERAKQVAELEQHARRRLNYLHYLRFSLFGF
jgi:predicted flap endonuclease-1-like 5' DNA nuclease